jgi:hypothetical protein
MVTTDERHVDELLESLGPKEWVLAEMIAGMGDFAALYRYRDKLLETHRGDWAAVYHGELICVVHGPQEIYEELERRGLATWQVAMCAIHPVRPFRFPLQLH